VEEEAEDMAARVCDEGFILTNQLTIFARALFLLCLIW